MTRRIFAVIPFGRRNVYFTTDYAKARDVPVTSDEARGLWHGPFQSTAGARIMLEHFRRSN